MSAPLNKELRNEHGVRILTLVRARDGRNEQCAKESMSLEGVEEKWSQSL